MSLFDQASLVVTPNGVKEGKLYSVKPTDGSGDLNVVRATSATRVNSEGLIEVVPRNLVSYSEQFDNAYWTKLTSDSTPNPIVTSNYATSPYGTQTAERVQLTLPSDNQYAIIKRGGLNPNAVVGSTIYQSIFLKATDISQVGKKVDVYVYDTTNSSYRRIFNHVLTNDWERIESNNLISFGSTSTSVEYAFGKARANASGQAGTKGTITSEAATDFLVWGAQLETSSVATSYFPTTDRLNIPRLDYSNGSCPSILVEPQRTNLQTYSGNLALVYSPTNVTQTSNFGISPDGTQTSTRVVLDNLSNSRSAETLTGILVNGTTYTFSCYYKGVAGETTYMNFISSSGGTNISKKILFNGEWQRESITFTAGSASNYTYIVDVRQGSSTATDFEVWGGQVEAGAYPTSYIPTVASQITRNQDVISKTGISSLIGQTEGTIFVDVNFDYISISSSNLISINNNVNTQAISLNRESNNRLQFFIFNSGVQANILTTSNVNGRFKVVATYKANEFKLYVNGVLIGTDTSGTLPTLTTFNLGNIVGGVIQKNNINSATLWKTALTEQECINLTTI